MITPEQFRSILESAMPMLKDAFSRKENTIPFDCVKVKGDKMIAFLEACPAPAKPIALTIDAEQTYVCSFSQLKFLATPEPTFFGPLGAVP